MYGKKEHYDTILNAFFPRVTGMASVGKWMWFSKMGNLIASSYDMVFIDLTQYGFLETLIPLWSRPPQNPSKYIMCVGWLSKT